MASMPPKAREAIELARRGELARAILSGEAAAREAPDDGGLRLFVGMLHARRLDLDRAVPHLSRAAALIPDSPAPRLELARALIGAGRIDEADAVARATAGGGGELIRVRALIAARRGAHRAAADLSRAALARDPRDFESWGHLGAALLALGEAQGAIEALMRALALRPDLITLHLRLAEAQAAAGEAEAGLDAARALAVAAPGDAAIRVAIARLEDLRERPEAAEAALREALAIAPACGPALLALADLAERGNRPDELEALLARAQSIGMPSAETALLRARSLCRRGDWQAALAAAEAAPAAGDGGARAALIGRIRDRLGDAAGAFAAFTEMNRAGAAATIGARRAAKEFRDHIALLSSTTSPLWYRSWAAANHVPIRPPPLFLFGFPRSGTTLVDTMLAGHGDLVIVEERPVLHAAAEQLGGIERLASLDAGEVAALRAAYFDALDQEAPGAAAAGKRIVDKLPFGMIETALVHRLFPDARIIFAERHPCDVVLSGFMTRFDPKGGMANFLDLEDLAALFDAAMTCWRRSCEVLPLNVHTIRYERVIEAPEAELRALIRFLGLAWDPAMLDHVASARRRGHIATPSYAQVAEPLNDRARGRWQRYRPQLAPVLPVLAPWCAAMGYAV